MLKNGIGYSGTKTSRSSLSCILNVYPLNGISLSSHPTVIMFLKWVFEPKSTTPRYIRTWDVSKVICSLEKMYDSKEFIIKGPDLKNCDGCNCLKMPNVSFY